MQHEMAFGIERDAVEIRLERATIEGVDVIGCEQDVPRDVSDVDAGLSKRAVVEHGPEQGPLRERPVRIPVMPFEGITAGEHR